MKGQAIILLLVFLPLLLLIFGLVGRSGGTILRHDQIENHCDKKILDALEVEARGLENLGRINRYSRIVIQARRIVDDLIVANSFYIISEPALISARNALRGVQHIIDKVQKATKATTSVAFSEKLITPTPQKFRGKIQETYRPRPLTDFYLQPDDGYEGEIGAPLEPSAQFKEKNIATGKIQVFTEKFLWWWPDTKRSPNMFLECKAHINIERLEDKWSVELMNPVGRL